MKYQPSLPEVNNNITPTHPLKEFGILLGGILGFLLLTYIVLGFLVDVAVNYISPEMEFELFSHTPFTRMADENNTTSPKQIKVQQLTDSLRKCVGISTPISVHIEQSDAANAMALPGGRIVIYSSLLDNIHSENGLSFVLAHELGHFKNRDHLRGLGRGIVLMAIATTLTGPNSSLTRMVTPTIQLGQAQYSQTREFLADKTGIHALHCLYGHVGGATEFFNTMAQEQTQGLPLSQYLASHPKMKERIAAIQQEAQTNNWDFQEPIPLLF